MYVKRLIPLIRKTLCVIVLLAIFFYAFGILPASPVQAESLADRGLILAESKSAMDNNYGYAPLDSKPSPALLATGTISGIVYETDGVTPLADIYISISGDNYGNNTCTNASGQFAFSGLPLGVQFRIQASPPWANCGQWSNYVQEFWQESQDKNNASLVTLDAQNPDRADINFTLDAGGVISGTVYAANGITPLQNIAISFHDDYDHYSNAICTDVNGHYEFHGLPFDLPVRVRTDAYRDSWCNAGADYNSEYWQETPNLASATLLTVTSLSPTRMGIDFTLEPAGSVSGTVYKADGVTPISNLLVSLVGNNYWSSECTDNLGHYTIGNVPFGSALFAQAVGGESWCGGGNYATEFWQESSSLGNATLLTVSAQNPNRTAIDFTLNTVPASDANLDVWYVDGIVDALDWPLGTHLTLQIDDITTPLLPDYSDEMDVTEVASWGPTLASFSTNGQFEIKPRMIVSVSGGSVTRMVRVANLAITNVNQNQDRITGSTEPNNWMWMYFADSCCRPIESNGTGSWMVDYSITGPNGEPIADIGPNSDGAIHVPSGDGKTSVAWNTSPPTVISSVRTNTSPTAASSVNFTVTFSESVKGVSINAPSDFSLTTTGSITGASISGISGLGTTRTVTVNTGSGSGTIRLNVIDNDSIVDSASDPLGGAGANNGNFMIGEAYEIDKTVPTVLSSTRANSNPTKAVSVNFLVTFSESVTGVEANDFTLTTTGVTSASISGVSGSGATRIVAVRTGIGDGTIRLNLVDDNTIVDGVLNLLGGAGAGNGNFFGGEIYTVDKPDLPAPVLRSPRTDIVINDTTPTFWWTSVKGGETYEIEFATSDPCTTVVDSEVVTETQYTHTAPFSDSAYCWRVRAYNISNQSGAWSLYRKFTVDTAGPSAPVLSSPITNANSNRTPTFRWLGVPAAVLYEFQYGDDSDFLDPIYTASIRGTFRKPPSMGIGTYYWHVRAKDSVGNWSNWSTPFKITIGP